MDEEVSPKKIHSTMIVPPEAKLPKPRPLKARRSRWRWLWLPVIVVLAAGAWYLWSRGGATAANAGGAPSKAGKKGGGGPVPVVAVKARRGNIGVYITGLGSVVPIYTVTVKSRVDGQLMKVHYAEGDMVHAGDLLAEIDPRPYQVQLEQFEGQMAKDIATLDNAKVDLDRYQKLLAQNAIPEQQLATQKALVAQQEGVVKSDQGMIDSAKLNLVYCNIKAEITGRVGLRLVDPGNIIHATDPNGLVVITQIQPISVIFTVAEDDLPVVLRKVAAHQSLRVDAYDRANTAKIGTGTLATVDNQIDPTTGSLRLRADFDNAANQLFPNQFVNIRLLVEEKGGVTLVSPAVIQRTTSTTYVFVVKDDQTVTVRQIQEGVTEGDSTEIISGIQPGDVVVRTGVDKLAEGTPVSVQIDNGQGSVPGAAGAPGNPAGPPRGAKSGGKKK